MKPRAVMRFGYYALLAAAIGAWSYCAAAWWSSREFQKSEARLSDPVEILRQMPTQAITPALLELLDILSSPILLIQNNPTGEWREAAAAQPLLAKAA